MRSKDLISAAFAVSLAASGSTRAQYANTQTSSLSASTDDAPAANADQKVVLEHRYSRYRLHASDVLELKFPFTPEFDQTVTVQPDGFITLRGVDSIHVQGQTLPELTRSLQTTYGKILHDPVINVELKDFEKPYFIVGGEVGHPGKFDLRGDPTTAEAVAIAGGLLPSAKHSQVLLFHRVSNGWVQSKKIDIKKMLKNGDLTEDVRLQPGDFLFVPKNAWSKVDRFMPTSSMGVYANPAYH